MSLIQSFLFFIMLVSLLLSQNIAADSVLRMGVLSLRPIKQETARWQPLAKYLSSELTDHSVTIQAYDYKGLEKAIQQHTLDFILTNPTHYFNLKNRQLISGILATLIDRAGENPLEAVGGVMFTLATRHDLNTLKDVQHSKIAVCSKNCMEAYHLTFEMFVDAGLTPPSENKIMFLGLPQDTVVKAVLSQRADVGFINAGVLERMHIEKLIDMTRLKIINRQDLTGFPYAVSTHLYPQWPLIAMNQTEATDARRLAAALLQIEANSALSNSLGIYGFTIPSSYASIDTLAQKLRLPPYDISPNFTLLDVWKNYRWPIIILCLIIFIIIILMVIIWFSRQKLKSAKRISNKRRRALSQSYAHLHTLVQTIPDLVWLKDTQGVFLSCNSQFEKLFGMPEAQIIGKTDYDFVKKELADFFRLKDQEAIDSGVSCINEEWVSFAGSKEKILLETIKTPMYDDMGVLKGVLGIGRDMTQRRADEDKLRFFARVVECSAEAFMITDTKGNIVSINPAFTKITGYAETEIIGRTPAILKSGRQDKIFYNKLWSSLKKNGTWAGEIWDRRKDGEIYPKWLNITSVKNNIGQTTHFIATFNDISERKLAEEQIHKLAFFDPLTNLANRRLFMDRIEHAQNISNRNQHYGALLLMDLDHFKTLNDTQGHVIGDRLLVEVANRLKQNIREMDTVSRLGGDEFVVLFEELGQEESMAVNSAESMAEKLREQINEPCFLEGAKRAYQTTASIGLTLFKGQDISINSLLKQADMALYQAKDAGRNTIRFFNPDMQAAIESRASMENALRKSLEQDELRLYYQPFVNSSGLCIGAEALLRWTSQELGSISPVHFIPLAEETGLIVPIGDWVMNTACAQLKAWQKNQATTHLTLSVNICAHQFQQPDFVSWVENKVIDSGVNPKQLKIELTESAVISNVDEAVSKMEMIKALGVTFSLDDFGTGYSSLSYLKKLPVEQVKIDRSFVNDIPEDINDAAIVRAILSMSKSLNLSVVAEGVEGNQQFMFLKQHGCPIFQGYYFGRPMPEKEFLEYIYNNVAKL